MTVANLCATESQTIEAVLEGRKFSSVQVRYLAGDMNDHNEFGKEPTVFIREMTGVELKDNGFTMEMPACSVAEITLR